MKLSKLIKKEPLFEYIDAKHEDEQYCPKCAIKLRESIKNSINELMEKEKPGLWANIRAKRARVGKAGMAKKGSKAYKAAKKAGDKINKEDELKEVNWGWWEKNVDKEWGWEEGTFKTLTWDGKKYPPGHNSEFMWNDWVNKAPGESTLSNHVFGPANKADQIKNGELPIPDNFKEVDEAKTKPAKGKRFAKKVKNPKTGRTRTVSYGQAGKAKKGGDRIRPGTAKGHAYCARSAKIKKCKNPPCANTLSRKKWKCQGSRSVPE